MSAVTYPVHVDAELDTHVSRWRWLFKWLLALPHYIVLAFLWMAFAVLSAVAFFAILFTGRYPRSIFEFNVGVLRWHWRVSYYAYGALGTDRYPPFTLHDVPDYPAHLEVDYPEHLSRGLVLVKWWLLAIPQYVIVGLLVGGAGYYVGNADDTWLMQGAGLIPLLVLIAGVVVLFTGRYPKPLFDLVLGLNRWVLRVAGYAALMTDTYPPFRLDQGGHEGGDAGMLTVTAPPATPPTTTPTPAVSSTASPAPPPVDARPHPPTTSRWTTGRIVSLVIGCVLAMGALGLAVPGFALLVVDQTARDGDGFLMGPEQTFATSTYAITSGDLRLHADAVHVGPAALWGHVKVTATAADGGALFVGIGPAAAVRSYLADVEHVTVTDVNDGHPVYRTATGGTPSVAPRAADFWAAKASGSGVQEVTWSPDNGDWAIVLMNEGAGRGVDATVTAGTDTAALPWVAGILLSLSGVGLVLAVILVAIPLRAVSREGGDATVTMVGEQSRE